MMLGFASSFLFLVSTSKGGRMMFGFTSSFLFWVPISKGGGDEVVAAVGGVSCCFSVLFAGMATFFSSPVSANAEVSFCLLSDICVAIGGERFVSTVAGSRGTEGGETFVSTVGGSTGTGGETFVTTVEGSTGGVSTSSSDNMAWEVLSFRNNCKSLHNMLSGSFSAEDAVTV